MTSGTVQRIAVVATGIVITVLLLFANKTNLDSSTAQGIANTAPSTSGEGMNLPPLAPVPKVDAWVDSLNFVKESKKIRILDSIVLNLQARNRFDYAAIYAEQKISLDSSLQSVLLAGELNQKAMRLPFVQQDSVLRRQFSAQSISFLQKVIDEEPNNERALLALGLAFTESGIPQQSMQGILTLRKILDINPNNVEASFQLGLFSAQTGQFDKAVQRFERVLELSPDNFGARYQLARAKLQLGEVSEAKNLLEAVVANSTDADLKQAANFLLNQLN